MSDVLEQFREFTRVWPWLDAALKSFPAETHRKEHVWAAIEKGEAQLWTNETAAQVTEITVYPTGLRVVNAWLAGGDLSGVRDLQDRVDEFARQKNCTLRSVHGRRGWLRALEGYQDAGTIMIRDLAW